jgi:protein PhnA
MSEHVCPVCGSENGYEDQVLWVCPDCGHEWNPAQESDADSSCFQVKDANGRVLQDGDSVVVIKDLKVKGASTPIKIGTKIKNIRLVDSDHNIDCHIPGFGKMAIKSEFTRFQSS